MLLGLVFYALGIVATIKAGIGYAPWEVFHVGLAETTGLSIGTASIIAGLVIVIAVTVMGEKFGLGTVCSMVLTGVFIDIIIYIDLIPAAEGFVTGVLMLAAGLFTIAFGSYFYIKSGFGVGPRDNLMVVLARKTKLPAGVCRFLVEALVTLVGWLLGGMVGAGTVISFIAIGFCVQAVFSLLRFDVTAVRHENISETISALVRPRRGKNREKS